MFDVKDSIETCYHPHPGERESKRVSDRETEKELTSLSLFIGSHVNGAESMILRYKLA